ncbi:uncharacterized protein LOC23687789 [Aedes aegypti]|uniref:Uncharacterized protein n=1 Tax=Aedes aegypti TaxID=7159 RepID=A0A6I8TQQ1_AEDAE|nr:uncharacterized protein LOC23687789 [Aedes aegypti]
MKNFLHSNWSSQANKMEKSNLFFKSASLALVLVAVFQLAPASPLHEAEEPITVPSIQFRSKTDQDLCAAYQLNGKMFITLNRCLGSEASRINQLTELDVVGKGQQAIQAFALQPSGTDSMGDLAVIMYTGAVEGGDQPQASSAGLFEKFGLRSLVRIGRRGRQDEAGAATENATDSAPFNGRNAQLIGAALTFVGSVLLMQ